MSSATGGIEDDVAAADPRGFGHAAKDRGANDAIALREPGEVRAAAVRANLGAGQRCQLAREAADAARRHGKRCRLRIGDMGRDDGRRIAACAGELRPAARRREPEDA
ncbi:MAG: hypothetical protein K2X49_11980 [Acetobacteraceae bacterium]|nr:hypothetical protein [Acetobacteraceae bacterium]